MEIKKSASADLEKERSLFTIMGFITVLAALYVAFEWTDSEKIVYQVESTAPVAEDNDVVVQTQQQAPPAPVAAPVAPILPPTIKIVDNSVNVKPTGDIFKDIPDGVTPPAAPAPISTPKIIKKDDDDKTIFVTVEKNPQYVGGPEALYKFLSKNIVYPPASKENGDQGRSTCQFVVEKDGSITDIQVIKSSGFPELDQAAIDVIKKMPKWIPGEQSGKKVRVKYILPVMFKLG